MVLLLKGISGPLNQLVVVHFQVQHILPCLDETSAKSSVVKGN